jgi:hypothetical protein
VPLRRALAAAFVLACAAIGQTTQRSESRPAPVDLRGPVRIEAGPMSAAKNGARLVVIVVVDQLGTDVLAAAWPYLSPDGFRRLERDGASYPRCAYVHACNETGPGHATIGTGATPAVHGIVGNDWIDASTRETINCCEDRATRMLSGSEPGASAHRLLAPTIGDAMKVAFGSRSKVASVSMKDRSAIFPVGASADRVVWFDRKTGLFSTSTAFAEALEGPETAWLQNLNAGRKVADVTEYVWDRAGPAAAYADLPPDDEIVEFPHGGTRTLPRTLRRENAKSLPEWCDWLAYSPAGLDLVFEHAHFLLTDFGLGADDVPDLLSIAPSSNDYVGHVFGPDSHEVRDMTLRTDRHIAALLATLDRTVGRGRYHVMLTADHGIAPIPEIAVRRGLAAGRVNGDKLRQGIETAMREEYGAPPANETWVAKTLDADILLNRKLIDTRKIALLDAQKVAARGAAKVNGVAEAVPTLDILERRLTPSPTHDAMLRSQMRSRSVDVYVLVKPYHLFGRTIASHGTPYLYDRAVPFFLTGPGVKPGHVSLADAAPGSGVVTIAALLGIVAPGGADHPVLEDAITR